MNARQGFFEAAIIEAQDTTPESTGNLPRYGGPLDSLWEVAAKRVIELAINEAVKLKDKALSKIDEDHERQAITADIVAALRSQNAPVVLIIAVESLLPLALAGVVSLAMGS